MIIGIVLGILLDPTVPTWLIPFLPVAVVTGLNALFGTERAWLEERFVDRVFVTSFFWNVVVACLLAFLGTQLGAGSAVTTAVVVVLGIRILSNTASIRRLFLRVWHERTEPGDDSLRAREWARASMAQRPPWTTQRPAPMDTGVTGVLRAAP